MGLRSNADRQRLHELCGARVGWRQHTSYQDTSGLAAATMYAYRVRAYKATGRVRLFSVG